MRPQKKNQDDAISPVVGVMLMIVVTVVIAAVITVFATGVVGDESSTTPVAMIELGKVDVDTIGGPLTYVEFIHKGGDVLLWENVEVSLVGDIQTITNYFPGVHGNLTMSGKSGTGVVAEAGDYITVTVNPMAENGKYHSKETVTWTMYDKKTDGILASGEFIVP